MSRPPSGHPSPVGFDTADAHSPPRAATDAAGAGAADADADADAAARAAGRLPVQSLVLAERIVCGAAIALAVREAHFDRLGLRLGVGLGLGSGLGFLTLTPTLP